MGLSLLFEEEKCLRPLVEEEKGRREKKRVLLL